MGECYPQFEKSDLGYRVFSVRAGTGMARQLRPSELADPSHCRAAAPQNRAARLTK